MGHEVFAGQVDSGEHCGTGRDGADRTRSKPATEAHPSTTNKTAS